MRAEVARRRSRRKLMRALLADDRWHRADASTTLTDAAAARKGEQPSPLSRCVAGGQRPCQGALGTPCVLAAAWLPTAMPAELLDFGALIGAALLVRADAQRTGRHGPLLRGLVGPYASPMAKVKEPDFIKYDGLVLRVDKGGRIVIPAEWRRALDARIGVLAWFDGKRVHLADSKEAADHARRVWSRGTAKRGIKKSRG